MVRHDMTRSLFLDDLNENLSYSNLKKFIEQEDKFNKLKSNMNCIYDAYFPRKTASRSKFDFDKSYAHFNFDPNIIFSDQKYIYVNLPDNQYARNLRKADTFYNHIDKQLKVSNRNNELYSKSNVSSKYSDRNNYSNKKIDLTIKDNRNCLVCEKTHNPIGYNKCKGEIYSSNIDYYKSEHDFSLDHVDAANIDTKNFKSNQHNGLRKTILSTPLIDSFRSIMNTEINKDIKDSSTQTELKHLRKPKNQRNTDIRKTAFHNDNGILFSNKVNMTPAYISSVREFNVDYVSEEEEGTACIALTDYSDFE